MIIDEFLIPYRKAISNFELHCEKGNEFNVFHLIQNIYGISEPKHSKFLAFLLNPIESHGKKDLYLNLFLDQLEIIYKHPKRSWIVEAERNYADISIKSSYPDKISIVIENKCYDAEDQENQLYRYWYNHIYTHFDKQFTKINKNNSRIIYLPKGDWKVYNPNSVEKIKDSDPDMHMDLITDWTFYKDINVWLSNCISEKKSENDRMTNFISDYKKYWEETNFKDERIMEAMKSQFKNEKQWKDFNNLAIYKDQLLKNWIGLIEEKFNLFHKDGWIFYNIFSKDLRLYTSDLATICVVYEYDKGIFIWKDGVTEEKRIYWNEHSKILIDNNSFNTIDDNSGYLAKCTLQIDKIVFDDKADFAWNAGNGDLPQIIFEIFKKILTPQLKVLFNKMDLFAVRSQSKPLSKWLSSFQ